MTRGKANLEHIFSLVPGDRGRLVLIKERQGNPSLIEVYRGRTRVLALKLSRAMLTREIKHSYGYSAGGELATGLARALGVEAGRVLQHGTSLMLRDGPEFRVEKVIEGDGRKGKD